MQLKNLGLIILFLSIGLLLSCERDEKCPSINSYSGTIIKEFETRGCFELMETDTLIILDTSSFLNIQTLVDSTYYSKIKDSCEIMTFDTINFSLYSLIGLFASGTGCIVNFNRNYTIDTQSKSYTYIITVEECGDCLKEEFSMNWIVVPKIDTLYSFQFVIEKTKK